MKFNLNNPAFLQAASQKSNVTLLTFSSGSPTINYGCSSEILVEFIKDGTPETMVLQPQLYGYQAVTINSDANSTIKMKGDLTYIGGHSGSGDFSGITEIDVTKNIALKTLYVYTGAEGLTSIDISKNKNLSTLLLGTASLETIRAIAINSSVANTIATTIRTGESATGTVFLRNGDEFNSTISDAATERGWTVEYVDA